jgi:multidrug efflux pump subunit AcrA (membrane-fusion protein)
MTKQTCETRRSTGRIITTAGILALLLAQLVLTGCSLLPAGRARTALQEETTPTPIPPPIVPSKPTYKVERGEVTKELLLRGRVSPVRESELFFRVSGRVRSVLVKRNDTVKAGQVLADLEIDAQERELVGARLELDRARARLKAAEDERADSIKRGQANLAIAQENLVIIQNQNPAPRKAQAEVALEKAKLALDKAQSDYDAVAWRGNVGASPQAAALQRATLDYTDAKAIYDLAMQAIANYPHQVAIAERQVELAQITLDGLNRGMDALLANDVKRAELAVQKLEIAITDAQIISPFDGKVTSINLTEGRAADAFKAVITVADASVLEVRSDPTGVSLDQLAEGMAATIFLVGRPGTQFAATIQRLPGPSWQTKETEIEKTIGFRLTDPQTGLEAGDLTRIQIVLERKADVLWLPPAAIRTFEGRKFVVVQENAGQRRIDVKLGIEGEDRVEIESGLTEGQTVIGQ